MKIKEFSIATRTFSTFFDLFCCPVCLSVSFESNWLIKFKTNFKKFNQNERLHFHNRDWNLCQFYWIEFLVFHDRKWTFLYSRVLCYQTHRYAAKCRKIYKLISRIWLNLAFKTFLLISLWWNITSFLFITFLNC